MYKIVVLKARDALSLSTVKAEQNKENEWYPDRKLMEKTKGKPFEKVD